MWRDSAHKGQGALPKNVRREIEERLKPIHEFLFEGLARRQG
jgi:hypothetical protein